MSLQKARVLCPSTRYYVPPQDIMSLQKARVAKSEVKCPTPTPTLTFPEFPNATSTPDSDSLT